MSGIGFSTGFCRRGCGGASRVRPKPRSGRIWWRWTVQWRGSSDLIADIGTKWGRRHVAASDFDVWSIGARLYPVLYWLTRVGGARNFCDGTELKAGLLGTGSRMEVHHIFPKAVLYEAGYERKQVNALGNLCFLTAACNKWIGAASPAEPSPYVKGKHDTDLRRIGIEGYFAFVRERHPGALESPVDSNGRGVVEGQELPGIP